MIRWSLCACLFLTVSFSNAAEMKQPPASLKVPPAPVLSPQKALASFVVAEGFVAELVASEPHVEDPVCLRFDGNGRIWVCEMRGFMPTIEGKGEDEPNGRIVILDDTNGDGQIDSSKVFLDGIVLPRAIALVEGGILYADMRKLYFVPNHNDKAGEAVIVDAAYSRGNLEHSSNGLMHGLDNWIYSANTDRRYRRIDGRWVSEKTEGRGQWGITKDNYGRLTTTSNSSVMRREVLAPSLTIRNPNHHFSNTGAFGTSSRVNPIRPTPGTNRAYKLSGDYVLHAITAACGMSVYRGDNFPPEYQGNVFTPAPAVNLVTRTIVTEDDGQFTATRANDPEFFATTDERSRIVNTYTAPDGTLYMVDLYRGILQHRAYLTPYLKIQIKSRGLDKPLGLGRIYRVRHKQTPAGKRPRMSQESSEQLVSHLDHPNGWWRDTAQRLLIERGDLEVIPILRRLAVSSDNHLARIHAMWTLDGLNSLDLKTLQGAATLDHPMSRAQVIRLAERFASSIVAAEFLHTLAGDQRYEVQLQLAFSLGVFRGKAQEHALATLAKVLIANPDLKVLNDAAMSGLAGSEAKFFAMVAPTKLPIANQLISAIVKSKNHDEIQYLHDLAHGDDDLQQRLTLSLAAGAISSQDVSATRLAFQRLSSAKLELQLSAAKAMLKAKDKRYRPFRLPVKPATLASWEKSDNKELSGQAKLLLELFSFSDKPPVEYITSAAHRAQYALGKRHYEHLCMGCHLKNGEGADTKGPPLAGSEWVLEDPRRTVAIVLNGVWGPIKVGGHTYNAPEILPLMPGLGTNSAVNDEQLAAVLTYVRNSWENHAPPVDPKAVAEMRQAISNSNVPFSEKELNDLDNTIKRLQSGPARQSLEQTLLAEGIESIVAAALSDGDAQRGGAFISEKKVSCTRCHSVKGIGPNLGPDLAALDSSKSNAYIVESILEPSKVVAKQYENVSIFTDSGKVVSGLLAERNEAHLVLRDITQNGRRIRLATDEIDEIVKLPSLMPKGLANEVSDRQGFLDLVRYLLELNKRAK